MAEQRNYRRTVTQALLMFITLVLALWTLRASAPAPRLPDEQITTHYLPLSGEELFELELAEAQTDTYTVTSTLDCVDKDGRSITLLGHDEAMYCASGSNGARLRLRLDSASPQHHLIMDGFAIEVRDSVADAHDDTPIATVGLARHADVVFPVPGMGAHHIVLHDPDTCTDPDEVSSDRSIRACVENGGLRDSLIVDSSERVEPRGPVGAAAPLVRVTPNHGELEPLRDDDRLWAGQVPFVVLQRRVERGVAFVEFRVPRAGVDTKDWLLTAGDRRWMSLELPRWPLAQLTESNVAWEVDGAEAFTFLSRELQFSTSTNPLKWNIHLSDQRIEWEQEEQLQGLIDHELLCLDSTFTGETEGEAHLPFPIRFAWNLETGRGCDGESVPAAPLRLHRLATQWAHHRATNERLQYTLSQMHQLPDQVPNPADLGFVFDWTHLANANDEMAIVPTRLIGVRPLSTRNGPRATSSLPEIREGVLCDLAKSGWGHPPISVTRGSTSGFLRVVRSTGRIQPGMRLLLVTDESSVCLGTTIPDREPVRADAGSAILGHFGVSRADQRWAPNTPVKNDGTTCALFTRTDADSSPPAWEVHRDGRGNILIETTGEQGGSEANLGPGDPKTLTHGDRLRLTAGGQELVLDVVLEDSPDLIAYSEATDDAVIRRYPFGEDLAGVLGVKGVVWGGLESHLDRSLWDEAQQAWEDSCGETPVEQQGIDLTLRGDIQRIVYSELAAAHTRRSREGLHARDPSTNRPVAQDTLRIQAVLLDAHSGDLLAVANAPSFDPNAIEELREEQDRLKKRDGRWQAPPEFDNQAFRRNKNIGSVYKLATSYAMARAGMLEDDETPASTISCDRQGFHEASVDDDGDLVLAPEQVGKIRLNETTQCASNEGGTRRYPVGSPGAGFLTSFRDSVNPYFAMGAMTLAPASGITWDITPSITVAAPHVHIRDAGPKRIHDFIFSPDFSIEDDLATGNRFFGSLVALGHRYHYGTQLRTQSVDAVNETEFPTRGASRWLPGVRSGGFVYPSVTGPELYGLSASERRDLELITRRGVDDNVHHVTAGVEHIASYAKISYGFGGVESNALALAVIGSPMIDGNVVSPSIVRDPSSEGRALTSPDFLDEGHRARIEAAMRSVVREGTADDFFVPRWGEWDGVGAKTGTFVTEIPRTSTVNIPLSRQHTAVRALKAYACGHVGADWDAIEWAEITELARNNSQRSYVSDVVSRIVAGDLTPRPGFGAGSATCDKLNANRAGVSDDIGPADDIETETDGDEVDGGVWLDELLVPYTPHQSSRLHLPGSSLVTVVFDGLDEQGSGQGLVLAVVADGHDPMAKTVSVQILARLRQYLQLQEQAGSATNAR